MTTIDARTLQLLHIGDPGDTVTDHDSTWSKVDDRAIQPDGNNWVRRLVIRDQDGTYWGADYRVPMRAGDPAPPLPWTAGEGGRHELTRLARYETVHVEYREAA